MKKIYLALLILLAALLFLLPASAKPSGTDGDWLARLETQYRADNGHALPQYAYDFYNWLVDAALGEGGALRQPTAGVGGVVEATTGGSQDRKTHLRYPIVTFTFDSTGMTKDECREEAHAQFEPYSQVVNHVLEAFRLDYPECNWLNNSLSFSQGTSTPNSGETIITTCTLSHHLLTTDANGNVTYDIRTTANPDPDALMALVEQAVEASGARATTNKRNQLTAINNYLTQINGYCSAAEFGPAQRDPATALAGNYGENGPVCVGYARAFKLMCDAMNIPCILVRGDAFNSNGDGEAHMWNQVKIDGYWLAVDVTWNDPVVEGQAPTALSGYECTTYLLAPYATMSMHVPSTDGFAPVPFLSVSGNQPNDATVTDHGVTTPYASINDAIEALLNASDDAVLTVDRSIQASRDIELHGRQKLLTASGATLSIKQNYKIIVRGGAEAELRGNFKSSSSDFIVHVYGTLMYSNNEIENSGGGVFKLYDGAVLNQTGGGIKAKTYAVAICSPDAKYNFTGGGINLDDGYMSAVFFDIPADANNTPQMYIDNSVYSPNSTYPNGRPLQVVVAWKDISVPVISYGTNNIPNVTAAPSTALLLSHNADSHVFSACDNTSADLIAYIGSTNFTDISAAIDAFHQAPDGAALVIFKDGTIFEINRPITLSGGKKLITQNGAALTFTNGATITVPAGESGEIGSGSFKTNSPDYLVHVYGTLTSSGGIYNEQG
ncbi:MAG: hypothetical protein IJC15_02950, partial [Clostridia bacterium]|nr:hypothetical protein [Clostridia bacterium]